MIYIGIIVLGKKHIAENENVIIHGFLAFDQVKILVLNIYTDRILNTGPNIIDLRSDLNRY